jgi:type VI secretion system secreted protein VgrG
MASCAACERRGLAGDGVLVQHRLRLVPRFDLLRHGSRSRVFQDATVPEVVGRVLGSVTPARWELARPQPRRAYITQYAESDRAFVERLLIEAGIYYFFAQPGDLVEELGRQPVPAPSALLASEVMVFADDASATLPKASSLHYLDSAGLAVARALAVTAFTPVQRVAVTHAEFRDYDPERPEFRVASRVAAPDGARAHGESLEAYEHHGHFHYPDPADAAHEAGRILARAQRRARTASGSSLVSALTPGHRFSLDGHPVPLANGEHTIVGVRHRGTVGLDEQAYANDFTCVPSNVAYVPTRGRRRTMHAMLTATVAGPRDGDVHVDAHGRIQVRFHWDREADSSDGSCWIRTLQGWGGASWGHQFIPRVGMEVAVAFDGGDPDKPIVLGCLYNGTHPMPFGLPQDKARSGIRTRTLNGTGSNELSFVDEADREQIYLRAERDLEVVAQHDHCVRVHHDQSIVVDRDRSERVGGDLHEIIGRDAHRTVLGDEQSSVAGARVDTVTGDHSSRVTGARLVRVEGAERVEVTGPVEHAYASMLTTLVDGHAMTIVGRHEKPGSSTHHTEGTSRIAASQSLVLTSTTEILLQVGASCLRIGPDRIDATSGAFGVRGGSAGLEASDDGLKFLADGSAQLVADALIIKTEDASLSMGSEVKIDGKKILLNAPERADDEHPDPEPRTRIELCDQDGSPLARQRYVLVLDDGTEQTGVLDAEGCVELDLSQSGTVSFPDLPAVRAS